MLSIERKFISYNSIDTNRDVQHHVLIANVARKRILLSLPNLFLYENGKSSKQTSNRYSNIISMFYRFLSEQEKYSGIDLGSYHVIADNRDIKRWQVSRQVERVRMQKDSPTSETIYEDAKILLVFFKWVAESGYITNVNVKTRTWTANFKNNKLLNYINSKSTTSIDAKNIEALDKERRQKSMSSLITNHEIKVFIKSFSDPVYVSLFKLALGSAMRPMDLCKFPYIGNGKNKHIFPYSDMKKKKNNTVSYRVVDSKGIKSRTIIINREDLRVLEEQYTQPYYAERAKKYQKKFGKKCPPSILFLNKKGIPVTPSMISSRSNDAKKAAMKNDSEFREGVTFYESRHWWPTMFLINFFGDKLLTQSADVLYAAAAEILKNQMGHEDVETTYKYYVDMARLIAMAHEGYVSELVTEQKESVEEFILRIDCPKNSEQTN